MVGVVLADVGEGDAVGMDGDEDEASVAAWCASSVLRIWSLLLVLWEVAVRLNWAWRRWSMSSALHCVVMQATHARELVGFGPGLSRQMPGLLVWRSLISFLVRVWGARLMMAPVVWGVVAKGVWVVWLGQTGGLAVVRCLLLRVIGLSVCSRP